MGTVEQYQDALAEYEAAGKAARDMVTVINEVREAMYPSQFPSFLGWSFGINDQISPGQRFDPKAKVDLGEWPDQQMMRDCFTAWHQALKKLQVAWGELPQDRRRGFSEPPSRMDIRGW